MAYQVREFPAQTLPALAVIVGVSSIAISYLIPVRLLQYPFAAVSVASFVFAVYYLAPRYEGFELTTIGAKLTEFGVFVGILVSYILSVFSSDMISDWFYIAAFLTVGLLAFRVLYRRGSQLVPLSQVVLFALLARAVMWYSAPVYGQDTRFHMGLSGYFLNAGELIPREIIYYHFFPIGHSLTAINAYLMGVDIKTAYFLATSLPQVVSLIALYLLTKRVLDSRHAVLGVLLFSVSSGPLLRGTQPYVQTTATSLLIIVLYLMLMSTDWRYRLLTLVLLPVIVVTHNLAPILLAGTSFLLIIITSAWKLRVDSSVYISALRRSSVTVFVITLPISIYYWVLSDYIRFQINRVALILSASEGTGQEAIESTNAALPPQTVLFSQELPAYFMWAAPLLMLIIIVSIGVYILLQEVITESKDRPKLLWFVLAITVFTGYSIAFALGGQGPVIRALPAVTAIVTPVMAFVVFRIARVGQPIGALLAVFLVLSIAVSGFLTPAVAIAERGEDDFKPIATNEEVHTVEFVKRYSTEPFVSDRYLSEYSFWDTVGSGTVPEDPAIRAALNNANVTTAEKHRAALDSTSQPIIYRDEFEGYYRIPPLDDRSRVYSSGESYIYTNE